MSGLLNSFVPEFPIPSEPGISFGETVIISYRLRPDLPGRFRSTDIRKTRCDLRHALDCDFVAVTSRTLPQSARTTHSFELLFTYSLPGTSDMSQSPFPARLRLVADLHRQHRQLGCAPKAQNQACAQLKSFRSQC
jgi:hypothetical protein